MDDEALERLANRVDAKSGSEPVQRRSIHTEAAQVPHVWEPPVAVRRSVLGKVFGALSPLELLFGASIVFFIGAAAVATLMISSGDNNVSTKNVGIAVSGPTSVRAGDVVTLQVVITNQNSVPMNLTDMLVEFPPGTRSDVDVTIDLPRTRTSLGTIEPGKSVNRTVKAVIFGQAKASADIKVTVEYRVPSSNAVFHSDTTYHALISQSPASITVDSLTEVVSGQPADITVHVQSNATELLSDMLLSISYPPGFKLTSATPAAAAGGSVWTIGDIEPGGERVVVLHGVFTGEDGDDRVMHFTAGTRKKNDPLAISAPLAANDITLTVTKPFVSVAIVLQNSTATQVTAKRGELVQGQIRWANNQAVRVQDVEIQVKITGTVLDRNTVKTDQAFYRSFDSTLIFNKERDPRLADVGPGEDGVSTFQFATLAPGQGSIQSPEVKLVATVTAKRSVEGGVPEVITSSAMASLVVETDLALNTTLSRVSGPLPPKVENETIYAVSWSVQNSANAIASTIVTATLPTYVEWKGQSNSPDVTYNPSARSLTWSIGDMAANQNRTVVFQLGFTPSVTQVTQMPVLIQGITVSAFDRFVRAQIERPQPAVTTQTGLPFSQGSVVP